MSWFAYMSGAGLNGPAAAAPATSSLTLVRGLDSADKEAFRNQVTGTLERRLFYTPSFKIYGGVAGLYDYGPPGCAVKSNVLALWRQHFVMEENMLEVDCTSVTPEVVLKASGHVDRFQDNMVKDVITSACFRADHVIKDHLNALSADPKNAASPLRSEWESTVATLDNLSLAELGACLKKYGVKAPETGNELSDPYPFNLMFSTSIGPSGTLQGYLRPETAQGIFVNFRDLLYYNGNKLPFAAAQIGQAFRNEIAPRQGLIRVREFTMAEIEHFVAPDNKAHPKFGPGVSHLNIPLYSQSRQTTGPHSAVITKLGTAVKDGVINNETLGYFIGRVWLFLLRVGIDPARLRFRQHLANEMAHYASDCWDAEIECSHGWIECVGLADRSAYDLTAHSAKSKVALQAFEQFPTKREMEVLTIVPDKKELGKHLKKEANAIAESLAAMKEDEALALRDALAAAKGAAVPYTMCGGAAPVMLTPAMVKITKDKQMVSGRSITPAVIEPSFGIGRIIYCLLEHSFATRNGDAARVVFTFPPIVAPIRCTVFPLQQDERLEVKAQAMAQLLVDAGVSSKIDTSSATIGKRYARTDEIGVPFAITVDYATLDNDTVTLRERDTCAQVRVPSADVAAVVRGIVEFGSSWAEVCAKYPAQEAKEEKE